MSRRTEQRDAIRHVLANARRPLTAQEILDCAVEDVPGLGIATVYRTIKTFQDDDWIVSVDLPGEPSRYELAELAHHHHFQCDRCSRVFDIHGCAHGIEKIAPAGFVVRRHEILLFGLCEDCAAAQ